MNRLVKFFHEVFHPHCEHCEIEKTRLFELERERTEASNHCVSCETLITTNNKLMEENQQLVQALIEKNKNPVEIKQETGEMKPIQTTKHIPWNTRRQMLEQESRAALRDKLQAAQPNIVKPELNRDKELAEIERELQDVSGTA